MSMETAGSSHYSQDDTTHNTNALQLPLYSPGSFSLPLNMPHAVYTVRVFKDTNDYTDAIHSCHIGKYTMCTCTGTQVHVHVHVYKCTSTSNNVFIAWYTAIWAMYGLMWLSKHLIG